MASETVAARAHLISRSEGLRAFGLDPSQPFELGVVDGVFGEDIPPGSVMRLDPLREPRQGWPVLVKDKQGKHYLRDYQEGAGGR